MTRRTPSEAALDERAHEAGPGAALVVAGGELEAQDPALPGEGDPGRDQRGHRDHPAALADLEVRGVQPEVGADDVGERAGPEGGDLGVEGGTDAGHLAAADPLDAQGPDEVVDPAGGDARDVRLLDDREQGPLGPPARLEEAGEVAAVADPGHREVDRAHPGVPAPVAVAVAVGQALLRVALALGDPGELAHLGLHDPLGEEADALAQQVEVAVGAHLAQGLEQGHAVVGHRGVLRVVGFSVQRREDDAVAVLLHGQFRCYTNSRDTTPRAG